MRYEFTFWILMLGISSYEPMALANAFSTKATQVSEGLEEVP
jgi:hypothetical protein